MIAYHVHLRSTDQFKQLGCVKKKDRNEINSVVDQRHNDADASSVNRPLFISFST